MGQCSLTSCFAATVAGYCIVGSDFPVTVSCVLPVLHGQLKRLSRDGLVEQAVTLLWVLLASPSPCLAYLAGSPEGVGICSDYDPEEDVSLLRLLLAGCSFSVLPISVLAGSTQPS